MSDFKAIMHQIRFRLRWGNSQRSPVLLAGFKGKGMAGEGGEEGKGRKGEREGEREEGLVFYTIIRPWPPPLSYPVGATAPRAPPSRRNVAVVSHAQYVFTATAAPASRVKAAMSKAAW